MEEETVRNIDLNQVSYLLEQMLLHGRLEGQSLENTIEFLRQNGIESSGKSVDLVWKAITLYQTLAKICPVEYASALQPSIEPDEVVQDFCTHKVTPAVIEMIDDKDWEGLQEVFLLLRRNHLLIHPLTLPKILSVCHKEFHLWPHLKYILGHRSLWLSLQREEWQWWYNLHHDTLEIQGLSLHQAIWNRIIGKPIDPVLVAKWERPNQVILLKLISQNSDIADLPLIVHLSDNGRFQKVRQMATDLLSKWYGSPTNLQFIRFGQAFMKKAVTRRNNQLLFRPDTPRPIEWLPITLDDITLYRHEFSNPLYRALSLVPAQLLYDHIADVLERIMLEMMYSKSWERLAQSIIFSLSSFRNDSWSSSLLKAFFDSYPDGNTIVLNIAPLIRRLPSNMIESLVLQILKDDDEFMLEKLSLILRSIQAYLGPAVSRGICEVYIKQVELGLSHTDKKHVRTSLLNLARWLDPKSVLILKKIWPYEALHFTDLKEDFWSWRNTLEQRYEMFLYISNSNE